MIVHHSSPINLQAPDERLDRYRALVLRHGDCWKYKRQREESCPGTRVLALAPRISVGRGFKGRTEIMETPFDQVVASYHRARQSGELFDTFYTIFLGKSPEIPPMFAQTDFPHQKLMLRESLLEMLLFVQTEGNRGEIERLAERHRQLNVKRAHYDMWLDSLCEALAKHDAKFSPTLDQYWRDAMRKGIEVMVDV